MDAHPVRNELTVHRYETADAIDAFHAAFDDALERVRARLPIRCSHRVGANKRGEGKTMTVTSPIDRDVAIGTFPIAGETTVDAAVNAATFAQADWAAVGVDARVDIVRDTATVMRSEKFDLAALITFENGKDRNEAMAEVDEAIDFLEYYADVYARADGYRQATGEPMTGEHCTRVRRPYGVFGVIGPFNFPLAILTGMTTGAVLTGNAAVVKPAESTSAIAHAMLDAFETAGLPPGVINLITGEGDPTGEAIVSHPDVDGIVFTGSRAVGTSIQRTFLEEEKPGPVIAELGGKNAVVVTGAASFDDAVNGVAAAAFGFAGQKCSATSRVYVVESMFDAFVDDLAAQAENFPNQPPTAPGKGLSPVIDENALERYLAISETADEIGTIHAGGVLAQDDALPDGRYVRPTVVTDVPHDHALAREEHFLPWVTVHPIEDLEDGIRKTNDSDFGLCAGIFSTDDVEVQAWFDRIEAGMTYANRTRSATTGALVGAQAFGGWKASGTTGNFAGGPWYLPQFTREQTRTRVSEPDV